MVDALLELDIVEVPHRERIEWIRSDDDNDDGLLFNSLFYLVLVYVFRSSLIFINYNVLSP